ncbi:adhesion G-protein coupled receptor D2 isoform X3 [Boleophthalmus pectinirostris]|uniref:adhesion G-protein coupled receptor D2 isoform X3 n=1 Tax=Boleophthalmus pectinirostris TaxID=150288 RepID=UPI00242C5986|nr:adhesion G-protein coupled receptor D2 isoform X3 [Boleophthalmus pectinirostris]
MHKTVWIKIKIFVCLQSFLSAAFSASHDETYYEYVPDHLQWEEAERVCKQRSGALASVSSSAENQDLSTFLKSLNISQPVWIARKTVADTQGSESLILEFAGRSDTKSARLRHKFTSMDSMTVCTKLRFDPNCFGISSVFSYSIPSYSHEFQLRANLIKAKPVQLALLVHGIHGPYHEAFEHDSSWHSVCVSWSQNRGHWAMFANGTSVSMGDGLHSSSRIGPDGLFVIGQEQVTFGGPFKKRESFSGSITQLHIWDRELTSHEIRTMENLCSPPSSGLMFKWSEEAMEIESTVTKLKDRTCQADFTAISNVTFMRVLEDGFLSNSYSINIPLKKLPVVDCAAFDPVVKNMSQTTCDSSQGAVCQFKKELNMNTSRKGDLKLLQHLTQTVLHDFETGAISSNSSKDLLLVLKQIETGLSSATASEVLVSIATNFIKLASLLLEPHMAAKWMGQTVDGDSVGPFDIVKTIDILTETLADMFSVEKRNFTLFTKNIGVDMKCQRLSNASKSEVFKPSTSHSFSVSNSDQDKLLISDTELQRLHRQGYEDVVLIHTHYSNLNDILAGAEQAAHNAKNSHKDNVRDNPQHLASAVISATVRGSVKPKNIPVTVHYTLSTSHKAKSSQQSVCAFWNFSLMQMNRWSSDGCTVVSADAGVVTCLCNHTTNFAVLMNYLESEWSPEEELILTKLTFIGCGASLCALVVTLMLFTVLDIPKSDRTSIHKNLFIALICAQVILLCSGSAIHNKVACTLVAALLHLFFMAAFSWMLVEGLLLWSKVVAVNLSEDRHMKYYYLIGWGLPVLIVTITLASASGKYSADGYCWLSVQTGVIWGFAGPVIFIIMVNILVLTRVVVITISTAKRRSILLAMGASPVEQAYEQIRAAVKAVLVLLPILGLTWLFGILVPFSIVMAYIFIILNSLQGLFIFLIYGVYNTEVRSTVNRIKERRKALNFSNCASSRPSSSMTSSRPTSLPLGIGPSQEEEANNMSTCSSAPGPTQEEEPTTGHVAMPSAPGRKEDPPGHTSSATQIKSRKAAFGPQLDTVPVGCSLHVPMDLEFSASCFPLGPRTNHHLVHIDH